MTGAYPTTSPAMNPEPNDLIATEVEFYEIDFPRPFF